MGLGAVAVPRPRAKSYNDFVRTLKISPPLSSSLTSKISRRTSVSSVFQLRLQKDLPLRLQRKSKMSQPPSPPSSPKRSHPGGDDRQPKKSKTDKDLPARFEGMKPTAKLFLEKVPSLGGLKRSFDPEGDENEFYAHRSKLTKLDCNNEHPVTNEVRAADWSANIKRKRSLALNLKDDPSMMPTAAQTGLSNFTGAICYRIALVQALVHIPQLVNWLRDYHSPDNCVLDDPAACFACLLRKLVVSYWSVTSRAALPNTIFKALHSLIKRRGWHQEGQGDPADQLTFFLLLLQEDLPASVYTMIDSLFRVYSQKTKTPCPCGEISASTDNNTQIQVALAPKEKHGDLVRYIARGLTTKLDDYRCDSCNKVEKRVATIKFEHVPEVFVMQFNMQDYLGRKLKSNVRVPTTINLTAFKAPESTDPHAFKYEIMSVVQHSGSDNMGHYVCSAVGPDGQWKLFNDSIVQGSGVGGVDRSFSPVLCFFKRTRDV